MEQLSAAGTQVIAPSLGRVQGDTRRFGEALGASLGIMSCAVLVPMAIGAAVAPALVPVVLGDGWELAAEVLPIVALATGLRLITQVVTAAAEASGRVDARLRVQSVSFFVYVGVIAITVAVGPTVLLVGLAWLFGETFRLLAHLWLSVRWLAVDGDRLVARMVTSATAAAAAAIPGLVLTRLPQLPAFLALALSLAAATGVLVVAWLALPRSQIRRDLEWSGVLKRVGRGRPAGVQ
jgi:PST family polysaccharide transporter